MVRFSGFARKTNHIPLFATEVCLHPEYLRESYGLNNYNYFIPSAKHLHLNVKRFKML
ncbi:MAG: hypothetical protein U5L45_01800 [Saprospiraceae bacterium]|nr:hypothetical protein [Saprospiraceae bacterium]